MGLVFVHRRGGTERAACMHCYARLGGVAKRRDEAKACEAILRCVQVPFAAFLRLTC